MKKASRTSKEEAKQSQLLSELADEADGDPMLLKSLIQKERTSLDPERRSIAGSVSKSPMNRFESKQELRETGQKASMDFTKSQAGGILDKSRVASIESSGK